MAKASMTVTSVDDAIKAYGPRNFVKAFNLTNRDLSMWRLNGIPARYELSLFIGLQRRGLVPSPKLFGFAHWEDLPG